MAPIVVDVCPTWLPSSNNHIQTVEALAMSANASTLLGSSRDRNNKEAKDLPCSQALGRFVV